MGTLIENDNPGGVDVPLFTDDGKVNVAGLAELAVLRPLIVPRESAAKTIGRELAKVFRSDGLKARATKHGVRVTFGKPKRGKP